MSIPDYFAQVERARQVGLRMTGVQADEFIRILTQYAEDLAARVSTDLAARVSTGAANQGAVYAHQLADEILRDMVRAMALSAGQNVRLTADQVADIYAAATGRLLEEFSAGVSLPAQSGLGIQAAQAVLARPELSAAFVTIRRSAIGFVDRIIPEAILRGLPTTELAMQLRLFIVGAEALPPGLLLDRRRIGYAAIRAMGYDPTPENLQAVRRYAGQIAARAQLIARTEPMNAEWEAHARSAELSPVVAGHRWRTSSRHPRPDQCDVLQDTDFYGLGAGVYPAGLLPKRPHPRCICHQLDILRPVDEWGVPRSPPPSLRVSGADAAQASGLSPSQEESLRRSLAANSSGPSGRRPARSAPPSTPPTTPPPSGGAGLPSTSRSTFVPQGDPGAAKRHAEAAFVQSFDISKIKAQAVDSIVAGVSAVLEGQGVKFGSMAAAGRGGPRHARAWYSHHPLRIGRPGYLDDSITFRQNYLRDPRSAAADSRANFQFMQAQSRQRLQSIARDPTDPRAARAQELLDDMAVTVRWSISSDAVDPLRATAAHEAGHVLFYRKGLSAEWSRRLAINGVTRRDRLAVSEYAASKDSELWSEVTAALATGREGQIPANILRAYRETLRVP